MDVRPAEPIDLPAIAEVLTRSWRDAYAGLMPAVLLDSLDSGRRLAQLERIYETGLARQSLLVATDEDTPVGTAWIGPERPEPEDMSSAELYAIYVLASHWGHGYGYALMEAAKSEMRRHGFARACLWVLDGNQQAEAFYRRQGWIRDSAIKLEEWGSFQLQEVRYLFPSL